MQTRRIDVYASKRLRSRSPTAAHPQQLGKMSPKQTSHSTAPQQPAGESQASEIDPQVAELTATAYHEAGHAVMATVLGRNIQKVTIKPGKIQTGGLRLGLCELATGRRRSSHDALEDEVLILLAGMVAEAKFTGRYCQLGASQDLRFASSMLQDRGGNDNHAQRLQRRLLDKTEHLLNEPAHVQAIMTVAKELIERTTISGRAVRHIVSQAIARKR